MDNTTSDTNANTVDALLERYLALLDEYTTLRAELSRLQTATFQHLARANFTAERGVRHGQDFYDERMQAMRRVAVSKAEGDAADAAAAAAAAGSVVFRVSKDSGHTTSPANVAEPGAEDHNDATSAPTEDGQPKDGHQGEEEEKAEEDEHAKGKSSQRSSSSIKDPLHWYGVLTPLALRQTQACAIDAVERVIPRLVTVDAAMRDLEIEVRRARKRRAKAEAAASKLVDMGSERKHVAKEVTAS